MQNKAKNMRGSASAIKLHAGGGIRFGFMRQNNISGRTLSVTDVCSYMFDADSFISYQLRDEDADINMIIADGDRPQDAYLALSCALKEKWFPALFSSMPPREWFKLKTGDSITVATDAVVVPQGWLVSRYNYVLTTKGRRVDGDYRQRKLTSLSDYLAEPFDYVLLVSDDGEHAIEVEKYENGSFKAYATVYRPLTDISETTQFRRPYIVAKKAADAKPVEIESKTSVTDALITENSKPAAENFAATLTLVSDATVIDATPEFLAKTTTETGVKKADESVIPTLVITKQETPTVSDAPATIPEHMLVCDTALVLRIMEEAKRNKVSLEDIIRKVLDLPKEITDRVYVPFELSEKELKVLSERYETKESDFNSIRKHIVEELRQFAGMK